MMNSRIKFKFNNFIYYNFYYIIIYFIFLIQLQNNFINACPSDVCQCKWKGGKQTVECGSQMLSKIPEGMDPGTQVLNFSGNILQILQNERFLRMDLINLQKIYLSRNQLIKIHEKSFRGLSNLVELDLSDNLLQQIPSDTFQDYTSLMRLSLNGNPIRDLKQSSFRHLSYLTTLELSNCQIERIENDAFIGMDNLEWLRLDGNRISYIQGNHILPKALHGISLQNNRWQCDCRLIDIHSWLINYNTPQTEEPKCIEPIRLKNQQIKTLKKDELACLPEVQPKSTYTEVFEGRNISIQCTVRAIPEPKVLWLFNGQVLTNDTILENLHMYYYIDESAGGEEKRSEVFIYNVGTEDNGTFSCIGQNTAGTTFSNYTLRVIIKEPPVVKEVHFPFRDYMSYIMISGGGVGCLFVLIVCTIAIKCTRQRRLRKQRIMKNCKSDSSGNPNDTIKCPSIINEEEMSSPKVSKENGILIGNGGGGLNMGSGICISGTNNNSGNGGGGGGIGMGHNGQMKQGFMMYVPSMQQNHIIDNSSMQLQNNSNAPTPTPDCNNDIDNMNGRLSAQYCSPPGSIRNYQQQDKNPDLINDAAESVHQNKFKMDSGEYEGSECSTTGPCNSIQNSNNNIGNNFEYQIANQQFGSQIIRPTHQQQQQQPRFTAMSTLPRGMHLKSSSLSVGGGGGNQHQVDVHLNPVCFLSQDGYAYDFSNNHLHSNNSGINMVGQQQHQQQQHQQQQQQPSNQQQQNFYRTLPHNRSGHNKLYSTSVPTSAANPGSRYSLEAEFLQRTGTPTYDKFVQNMRFTAEGYPVHPAAAIAAIVQYPSPPDGYKTIGITDGNGGQSTTTICPSGTSFQQWPPCLPGYHVQPIRYSSSPITGSLVSVQSIQQQSSSSQINQQPSQSVGVNVQPVTSSHTQTSTNTSSSSSSSATPTSATNDIGVKKRCVGAQTTDLDPSTIPECDEEQESSTGNGNCTKLRHLTGPLADSPDEGYVGDSQEGSDI